MMEHKLGTSSVIDLIKIIKETLQHKSLKVAPVYADISRQNNFAKRFNYRGIFTPHSPTPGSVFV